MGPDSAEVEIFRTINGKGGSCRCTIRGRNSVSKYNRNAFRLRRKAFGFRKPKAQFSQRLPDRGGEARRRAFPDSFSRRPPLGSRRGMILPRWITQKSSFLCEPP